MAIGCINILVSIGFAILTLYVFDWARVNEMAIARSYFRIWIITIIGSLMVFGPLSIGCRLMRPPSSRYSTGMSIRVLSSWIFYLLLLMPSAGVLYFVIGIMEEWARSLKDSPIDVEILPGLKIAIFIASAWGLLMPGVLRIMWRSPVYDRRLADSEGPRYLPFEEQPAHPIEDKDDNMQQQPISPEDIRMEKELRASFDLDPTNRNVGRRLSRQLQNMEKSEDALQVYDALIGQFPDDITLLQEKAELYLKQGDQIRYVKTIGRINRIEAQTSFEENIGQRITLKTMEVEDLDFFGPIKWGFNSQINVLLGKNGYGKSHLLRALVAVAQSDEEISEVFFENSGRKAMIKVEIEKDDQIQSALRKRVVFEKSFGKIPVLAIPDMRYVDKSGETVGVPQVVTDLRSDGARHFLNEQSYEGIILQFLYDLCLDYLDQKSTDQPFFKLMESTVAKLTGSDFKFESIQRKGSASFAIRVLTDGNEDHPLPLQKASQGTLSVLVMFGLIYKYLKSLYADIPASDLLQQHAIVLIDEIDAHLHPTWQQHILQLFRDTFPNIQFIVTAHSPLVVAGCKKREVAVLRKNDKGFIVEVLDDHFIGATSEDIYRRIFEVEDKDLAYLRLNTLYSSKSEIEKKIDTYGDRDELTEAQRQELDDLRSRLFYLREFEETRNKRKEKDQLARKYEKLKMESRQLRGRIDELQKEISGYERRQPEDQFQIPEDLIRTFIEQFPDQSKPIEAYADYLSDRGMNEEAMRILEILHQSLPENIHVIKDLATQYQLMSQYEKASDLLEQASKEMPEDLDLQAGLERVSQIVKKQT